MTVVGVKYEEHWEPWEIGEDIDSSWGRKFDIPDDVLARFEKAKAMMEQSWQELSEYIDFD